VIRCRAITHDDLVDEEYNQQNVTKTLRSVDLYLKKIEGNKKFTEIVFMMVSKSML